MEWVQPGPTLCERMNVFLSFPLYYWGMIHALLVHYPKTNWGGTQTLSPTPMCLGVVHLLCTSSIFSISLTLLHLSLKV
jgi:hypothetical protein